MAKRAGFGSFLGETLGLSVSEPVATPAKKPDVPKGRGIIGEILTDVIGVEASAGLKQGTADFIDDIFHKSPAPELRKKPVVEAKPVAQVTAGKPQEERLLTGGGTAAEPPVSRGRQFINTAVFIVGGGVKLGADVVRGTGKVVRATQETIRKKVEERQAKVREGATIIDEEVKE